MLSLHFENVEIEDVFHIAANLSANGLSRVEIQNLFSAKPLGVKKKQSAFEEATSTGVTGKLA